MQTNLKDLFYDLGQLVPTKIDEDSFIFNEDNLPRIPKTIMSSEIVIKNGYHFYDFLYRADFLHFYANKDIYKYLGLTILSLIFNDERKSFKLILTHPDSEIKEILINFSYYSICSYIPKPDCFDYCPMEVQKHPWLDFNNNDRELPGFFLTSENHKLIMKDWEKRDVIMIKSTDHGTARLAELFLNISNPNLEKVEFDLEGGLGFKGVSLGSAEIRFNLPGSLSWSDDFKL